jgi:membrane protein DedA with SNARE-associated domain
MDLYAVLIALGVGIVIGIFIGYTIGRQMAEMLRARFDMMWIWNSRKNYRNYF